MERIFFFGQRINATKVACTKDTSYPLLNNICSNKRDPHFIAKMGVENYLILILGPLRRVKGDSCSIARTEVENYPFLWLVSSTVLQPFFS